MEMVATTPLSAAQDRFGALRLAAFSRRGFRADPQWFTDGPGRGTYAMVHGDGPRTTVLVHGGVGNGIEWADIAAHLPGRVVIPDRPGFGLSYAHRYERATYRAEAAAWVLDVADGLGVDEVDLVAGSMGGFFAIAFASAHPDRVRRLVLTGAAAGLFPNPGLFLRLWATPGIGALVSRLKLQDIDTIRRRMFGAYVVHPDRLAEDVLEVALRGVNLAGTADANRAMLRSVATLRGWRPDMRLDDALASLEVPTLFAWGDHDKVAGPQVAFDLAPRMHDAKAVVVKDAGHLPQLDQPDQVAAAINDFLR